jgi:hypothetical protein
LKSYNTRTTFKQVLNDVRVVKTSVKLVVKQLDRAGSGQSMVAERGSGNERNYNSYGFDPVGFLASDGLKRTAPWWGYFGAQQLDVE